MKHVWIKAAALLLLACLLLPTVASCGGEKGTRLISFSQAHTMKELKKYEGETVSIIGYMSTLSPISGEFMYLMNMPYQSCPFCLPNTTQLSNTMAIYAKDKNGFEFTDRAIRVTGTMEFGDFEDSFGYQYYYRISDATYEILDVSEMSDSLKLWQSLAASDVIGEIYQMLDYVDFLCRWPVYTLKVNGLHTYARPDQALSRIETEGAQYNYGFREGYFDDLIASVRAVDGTAFEDVVTMIESARALCEKAYLELKNGQYAVVKEYSGEFKDGRDQYRLYLINELTSEASAIYQAFSTWIAKWEI